jgi:tRNA-Thr(GGU) m(6)t(6)A37 methyltransferase TsaA
MFSYTINPIGVIRSGLVRREAAPHQGFEGAPDAWIEMDSTVAEGLEGIAAGDDIILITWLHQADRDLLKVHPRRDPNRPLTGVFATRSPHRPNPIGLHRVRVLEIAGNRLKVGPLEAIDGTPIVDIKPVLPQSKDFAFGCPIGNLAQEMGDLSPAFREKLRQGLDSMVDLYAEVLAEAQEAGDLSKGLDVREAAYFLVYSWHGALMHMKAVKGPAPLENHLKSIFDYVLTPHVRGGHAS